MVSITVSDIMSRSTSNLKLYILELYRVGINPWGIFIFRFCIIYFLGGCTCMSYVNKLIKIKYWYFLFVITQNVIH